jgi:hypothetical protein
MIKQLVFYVALLGWSCSIFGQNTGANPLIHSHNDYLNEVPFYEAFINGASSIEMDSPCKCWFTGGYCPKMQTKIL